MVKTFGENFLKYDFNLFILVSSRYEGRILKTVFKGLSRLGNGEVYFIFALMMFIAGGPNGRLIALTVLIAFSIELPVYLLVKNSVKRLRPFERFPQVKFLIEPPDHYSFPSGHTAAAFLMARIISWPFAELAIPLFLLAGLIGYSRIYLRVHYPSDVFFGFVLGQLTANLALWIIF